ncbi:MAG: hypothetical protein WDO19_15245 [Bacteroidota bacterium]
MDYAPYNHKTKKLLYDLAALQPRPWLRCMALLILEIAAEFLKDLDEVMKEIWGEKLAVANF